MTLRERIEAARARSLSREAALERSRQIREANRGRDLEVSTAKPAPPPRPLKADARAPEVEHLIRTIERRAATRLGGKLTARERRALYLLRAERLDDFMQEFGKSTWWDRPETKWGIGA